MIRLVVFDIDGVLTDGNVFVDEDGREYKRYSLTEIDAINDLKRQGYMIAAITGEDTPIVNVFRQKIPWDDFLSGCKDKLAGIHHLEEKFGIGKEEICYIGDGKYDVPAIKYVGFGVAPSNAVPAAKVTAAVVLRGRGGKDCIQELSSFLEMKKVLKSECRADSCTGRE